MAKKKAVEELSASELYKLAQQREKEEQRNALELNKKEIESLRAERRALVASHKKELNLIDVRIRKLGGRKMKKTTPRSSSGNLTESIVSIVSTAGEISIKDLKASLAAEGIAANNLNQTLAYLKSKGRLKSPARSIYSAA